MVYVSNAQAVLEEVAFLNVHKTERRWHCSDGLIAGGNDNDNGALLFDFDDDLVLVGPASSYYQTQIEGEETPSQFERNWANSQYRVSTISSPGSQMVDESIDRGLFGTSISNKHTHSAYDVL
jgi:hypothetical protein